MFERAKPTDEIDRGGHSNYERAPYISLPLDAFVHVHRHLATQILDFGVYRRDAAIMRDLDKSPRTLLITGIVPLYSSFAFVAHLSCENTCLGYRSKAVLHRDNATDSNLAYGTFHLPHYRVQLPCSAPMMCGKQHFNTSCDSDCVFVLRE